MKFLLLPLILALATSVFAAEGGKNGGFYEFGLGGNNATVKLEDTYEHNGGYSTYVGFGRGGTYRIKGSIFQATAGEGNRQKINFMNLETGIYGVDVGMSGGWWALDAGYAWGYVRYKFVDTDAGQEIGDFNKYFLDSQGFHLQLTLAPMKRGKFDWMGITAHYIHLGSDGFKREIKENGSTSTRRGNKSYDTDFIFIMLSFVNGGMRK